MNYDHQFRIKPGSKVKLRDIDPDFKDRHAGHKDAQEEIMEYALRLRDLQELLYAENKRSLLICLQAMDAGGKDGTINHVLGTMNPQGCRAVSFKQPIGSSGSRFPLADPPGRPAQGRGCDLQPLPLRGCAGGPGP